MNASDTSRRDFESIPHTADIQLRIHGSTVAELFRHAVIGMFQVTRPQGPSCTQHDDRIICFPLTQQRTISLTAPDQLLLLIAFLSEALYLSDAYNEAYFDATIEQLTETKVQATLHGAVITGFEGFEIKAVTYHEASLVDTATGWEALVVFDI